MSLKFGKTTELLHYHKYVWTFKMENRSVYVLVILFFEWEYNCFTVLCQFLPCGWTQSLSQSEVSQKEKNKYHVSVYMWSLEKCYQ